MFRGGNAPIIRNLVISASGISWAEGSSKKSAASVRPFDTTCSSLKRGKHSCASGNLCASTILRPIASICSRINEYELRIIRKLILHAVMSASGSGLWEQRIVHIIFSSFSSKLILAFGYSGDPNTFVIVISDLVLHEAINKTNNNGMYFFIV